MPSCVTVGSNDGGTRPMYLDGISMRDAREAFGVPGLKCESDPSKQGYCSLMGIGNYCGRTEEEKIDEARRRMENRLYFMGITAHGYQEPILEGINPDPKYRDANTGKPVISTFLPDPNEENVDFDRVAETYRTIDVYSGLVDGRNYGKFNRLRQHKIRHTRNPNGTEKRFCVPITNMMNYGWWQRDLDQLNQTKWYSARERAPIVRSDITKFVDDMFHHDPSFMLF